MDQRSIPGKGEEVESGLKISSAVFMFFFRAPPCARQSGFLSQELSADRKKLGVLGRVGGEYQPRSIVTSPSPGGADRLPAPPLASLDS